MANSVLIAGGGFRGIVSAYVLRRRGFDVTLVERAPFLGAVLSPFKWDDHGLVLDKGCHLFGSGNQDYDDIMLDILDGNFQSHDLNVASVFNGRLSQDAVVPDFTSLDPSEVSKILSEIIAAAVRDPEETTSDTLASTLVKRFGTTAGGYLNGVCAKMAASPADQLAAAAMHTILGQRIKIADDDIADFLKQLGPLDDRIAATNKRDPYKYLGGSNPKLPHRHFYPKHGGTGALANGARDYLEAAGCRVLLGTSIDAFRATKKGVSVDIGGTAHDYDYLIWALDASLFGKIALGRDEISDKVHNTPMVLYYFLTPAKEIGNLSYIQNYDVNDLTFRVSSAGVYSNQITPDGNTYVCAEVVTSMGSDLWQSPDAFSGQVWNEALRVGMVKSEQPIDKMVKTTPVSYKHEKVGFADAFSDAEQQIKKMTDRVIITDPMLLGYAAIMEMLDRIGVH